MSFNITGDNPLYIDASDMEGKLKTMQRIMRKEQYEKLLYDCGEADGIFGAKTEAAVRNFQRDHSLTVDGIAGRDTQAALYAAEDAPQPTYTVTLHQVPEAEAIALTAKYAGVKTKE